MYDDGSSELLKGCGKCNGRFFFFIRKEKLKDAEEEIKKLTPREKEKIEKDVFDIIGGVAEDDKPVILDLESVKVLKPGKFEVDVVNLFKGKPIIYKMESGKYVIDLATTFQQLRKKF
tara:strand:- start:146 stop:499 length:354 start_codon:yes stop_codon:yes gene_type:complete